MKVTKEPNEEDIHSAMPLVEALRSVILEKENESKEVRS